MDDLIQRAQQGDSEAFAALFERSKQPLWQAAMAVLGNVSCCTCKVTRSSGAPSRARTVQLCGAMFRGLSA